MTSVPLNPSSENLGIPSPEGPFLFSTLPRCALPYGRVVALAATGACDRAQNITVPACGMCSPRRAPARRIALPPARGQPAPGAVVHAAQTFDSPIGSLMTSTDDPRSQ